MRGILSFDLARPQVEPAAPNALGHLWNAYPGEKADFLVISRSCDSPMPQPIEIAILSDRHFWREGYDKAEEGAGIWSAFRLPD